LQRVWVIIALTTLVLVIAAFLQEESYITSLLAAVTWPLAILAVVLIFEDPLKKKLGELSSADIQGNSGKPARVPAIRRETRQPGQAVRRKN
jgi:hypothetical protein